MIDFDISSLQNPQVKDVVKLRQRRDRDRSGNFLVEGYREILRAKEGRLKIHTLFTCESLFLGSNEGRLIQELEAQGTRTLTCTEAVFQKLSYRDRPDGLLAIAPQLKHQLSDLTISENAFFLIAESIEKPGNLGTILRSSDAVGLDAVIVCDRCTDIHNPNVVRASVGTLFTRPVIEAKGDDVLAFLKDNGVQIVSATPDTALEYTQADFKGPVAIVVGTEQYGLTEKWLDESFTRVRIPMNGHADSLNVATATSILLYEVLRQRA